VTRTRRDQLLLAIKRVKQRLKDGEQLSILKVAEEAGVSNSLIHNRYPEIAERIRAETGKSSRTQRNQAREELAESKKTIAELRRDLRAAGADIQRLASVNLALTLELDELKAVTSAANVTPIGRKRPS